MAYISLKRDIMRSIPVSLTKNGARASVRIPNSTLQGLQKKEYNHPVIWTSGAYIRGRELIGSDEKSFEHDLTSFLSDPLKYDHLMFGKAVNMHISESLYTNGRYEALKENEDLYMHDELKHVGTSSVLIETKVDDLKRSWLFTVTSLYIRIDTNSRTPTGHPPDWVSKFKPEVPLEKVTFVTKQARGESYMQEWKILPEHIDDFNNHCSFFSYFILIHKTGKLALEDGALKNRTMSNGKTIQILYAGECGVGDEVQVFVWPDEEHARKTHCEMIKKGGGLICYMTFDEYEFADIFHNPTKL